MNFAEECDLSTLDQDLRRKLHDELLQLQLQYEKDKNQLIEEAFQVQETRKQPVNNAAENPSGEEDFNSASEHRSENFEFNQTQHDNINQAELFNSDQETRSVASNEKNLSDVTSLRLSSMQSSSILDENPSSPVLLRKPTFKKRKHSRRFFPSMSVSCLKKLTSTDGGENFILPESILSGGDCLRHIDDAPLIKSAENSVNLCMKNTEIEKMSMMVDGSNHYLALIESEFCIQIYSKISEKWLESWTIESKESVDDIEWLVNDADPDFVYLLMINMKSASIWLSQFHSDPENRISNLCRVDVVRLTCLVVLAPSNLVVSGEKVLKYSFNHAKKNFQEEIVMMPVDDDIITMNALNHEADALIGCSQSIIYLWNHITGSLLRQFDLKCSDQNISRLLNVTSLEGALLCHILFEYEFKQFCCVYVINPSNGCSSLVSRDLEAPSYAVLRLYDKTNNRQYSVHGLSHIASVLGSFPLLQEPILKQNSCGLFSLLQFSC